MDKVRRLYTLLREHGIDARLDLPAAEQRQDWAQWPLREIRAARFVLVIASPQYRRRAEEDAPPTEGRGVRWEAKLIREAVYADQSAALNRFIPVILPGCSSADIPEFLGPTSNTYYRVTDYTVSGSEALLRLLTDQPFETVPTLGRMPVLGARAAAGTLSDSTPDLVELVKRMASRLAGRNDASVQADVRQLLLVEDFGLSEKDLGAEPDTSLDGRRRITIAVSCITFEVLGDLRAAETTRIAELQLTRHLTDVRAVTRRRQVGVLTDGAEWRLYCVLDGQLHEVDRLLVDLARPEVGGLLSWLEAVLATANRIEPTPGEIERKLGSSSPAYKLDAAELTAIFARCRDLPTVRIKRRLWGKLLTTALGTNFSDNDALFVDHTLLVAMAEIIGHAVVGFFRPTQSAIDAVTLMSGERFAEAQINGVIEPDFFDWIVHVQDGPEFIADLIRRLARFTWDNVEHDVMKTLYESIISPQVRHRLGEYYTPGWLAQEIVNQCIKDPLAERVLDASCGSGTFLFHAVRKYLTAAEDAGESNVHAVSAVTTHVIGIDVHPVAVTLARVTYLLAIGSRRLQSDDRPPFTVPVYLGDSLRWGEEATLLSYAGLSISTDENYEIYAPNKYAEQLLFPDRILGDATRFGELVSEMAERATRRTPGSAVPSLAILFRRLDIHPGDYHVLEETFALMCRLHDEDRDHIWGYYVRNLARPLWLAQPDNRVDVLVGNPPWLAYRYMTASQQPAFRAMSGDRGLWAGAALATNQDLSALFVTRCIELYLRPGGRFGYVMPLAALSRRQYEGFRTGSYAAPSEPITVSFDRPYDLHKIKPPFFPVPACVIRGQRQHFAASAKPLAGPAEIWAGRFSTDRASHSDAMASIARVTGEAAPVPALRPSPYASRFVQGATVVPRMLFLVEIDHTNPLGTGQRRAVHSRRSRNEKSPWKGLEPLHGFVERQFIRPVYLGDAVLPFRVLPPLDAVMPLYGHELLRGDNDRLDDYPGLAKWWRSAEAVWTDNRSSERLDLTERLDYRRGIVKQLPGAVHRVVYAASGMYMAAAIVSDPAAIIEHKLYWAAAQSLEEARFLEALLNSTVVTAAVRPLQGRGEHNPRDFDKYVFRLPLPLYDPTEMAHTQLLQLAERAEDLAAAVALPEVRFETKRRHIRQALTVDGVMAEIDAIVKDLLD